MSGTHRLNELKTQGYTLLASLGWNSQKLLIYKVSLPESQKESQSTFLSPTQTGCSSGWELEFRIDDLINTLWRTTSHAETETDTAS